MRQIPHKPPEDAISEARRHPNGWVYEVDPRYDGNDFIPPQGIMGAWKVDENGNIVGAYIVNPRYKENALADATSLEEGK